MSKDLGSFPSRPLIHPLPPSFPASPVAPLLGPCHRHPQAALALEQSPSEGARTQFSLLAATKAISLLCPDPGRSSRAAARGTQRRITPLGEALLPRGGLRLVPLPSPRPRHVLPAQHPTGLPRHRSSARLRLAGFVRS